MRSISTYNLYDFSRFSCKILSSVFDYWEVVSVNGIPFGSTSSFFGAIFYLFAKQMVTFCGLQLQENEDIKQKLEKCEAEIEKTRKTDELTLIPISSFTRYDSSANKKLFIFVRTLYSHAKTWYICFLWVVLPLWFAILAYQIELKTSRSRD